MAFLAFAALAANESTTAFTPNVPGKGPVRFDQNGGASSSSSGNNNVGRQQQQKPNVSPRNSSSNGSSSISSSTGGTDEDAVPKAYEDFRQVHGKGDLPFDSLRYQHFESNYVALMRANAEALKRARAQGLPDPEPMALNEFGDCSFEEFKTLQSGAKPPPPSPTGPGTGINKGSTTTGPTKQKPRAASYLDSLQSQDQAGYARQGVEADAQAKRRAEEGTRLEALRNAEEEQRMKIEEEARRRAQEQARIQAERDSARLKAEEDARHRAQEQEAATRRAAEERAEARRKAQEATRAKAEEDARRRAHEQEEAARRAAEDKARRIEARRRAEEQARIKAEQDQLMREQEEARRRAQFQEEKARRAAEEKARLREQEEARILAEEHARIQEEEALLVAEERARTRAEEEAWRMAEEEEMKHAVAEERALARMRAEEMKHAAAEERARFQAEEEARRVAEERVAEDRRRMQEEVRIAAAARARSQQEEQAKRMNQDKESMLLEGTKLGARMKTGEQAKRRAGFPSTEGEVRIKPQGKPQVPTAARNPDREISWERESTVPTGDAHAGLQARLKKENDAAQKRRTDLLSQPVTGDQAGFGTGTTSREWTGSQAPGKAQGVESGSASMQGENEAPARGNAAAPEGEPVVMLTKFQREAAAKANAQRRDSGSAEWQARLKREAEAAARSNARGAGFAPGLDKGNPQRGEQANWNSTHDKTSEPARAVAPSDKNAETAWSQSSDGMVGKPSKPISRAQGTEPSSDVQKKVSAIGARVSELTKIISKLTTDMTAVVKVSKAGAPAPQGTSSNNGGLAEVSNQLEIVEQLSTSVSELMANQGKQGEFVQVIADNNIEMTKMIVGLREELEEMKTEMFQSTEQQSSLEDRLAALEARITGQPTSPQLQDKQRMDKPENPFQELSPAAFVSRKAASDLGAKSKTQTFTRQENQPKSMAERMALEQQNKPKSMAERVALEEQKQPKSMAERIAQEEQRRPKSLQERMTLEEQTKQKNKFNSTAERTKTEEQQKPMPMFERIALEQKQARKNATGGAGQPRTSSEQTVTKQQEKLPQPPADDVLAENKSTGKGDSAGEKIASVSAKNSGDDASKTPGVEAGTKLAEPATGKQEKLTNLTSSVATETESSSSAKEDKMKDGSTKNDIKGEKEKTELDGVNSTTVEKEKSKLDDDNSKDVAKGEKEEAKVNVKVDIEALKNSDKSEKETTKVDKDTKISTEEKTKSSSAPWKLW